MPRSSNQKLKLLRIYNYLLEYTDGEHTVTAADIIKELDKREGKLFLTVEPHLRVFKGLEALETDEKTKMPNTYATSYEAFGAAVDAIKAIIAK